MTLQERLDAIENTIEITRQGIEFDKRYRLAVGPENQLPRDPENVDMEAQVRDQENSIAVLEGIAAGFRRRIEAGEE